MKRCTSCLQEKPESDFYVRRKSPDGLSYKCKPCSSAWAKVYLANNQLAYEKQREQSRQTRLDNPIRHADYSRKYRHNITKEQYEALLELQGGVCASCGRPETGRDSVTGTLWNLSVDHDHACCPGKRSCGKCIRGLLCNKCNRASGLLDDDPAKIKALFEYRLSAVGP